MRPRRLQTGLERAEARIPIHRLVDDKAPADGEGFEPPVPFWGTAVFKTAAFDHSATHPIFLDLFPNTR